MSTHTRDTRHRGKRIAHIGAAAAALVMSIHAGATPHASAAADDGALFVHSPTTLFTVNPTTSALTEVGPLTGCGNPAVDLAISSTGQAFATAWGGPQSQGLYQVDLATGACTLVASGLYGNNLSFVPAGVLGPTETLVQYSDGDYVSIDTETGAVTTISTGPLGGNIVAGDIVSSDSGPTYVTVTQGIGSCPDSGGDCLVQVDPATGTIIRNFGGIGAGFTETFGIAQYAGRVWVATGLSQVGAVTIDETAGTATIDPGTVSTHSTPFYGASSSLAAPSAPAPTMSAVTPDQVSAGATIQITGTNFTSDTTVTVGGQPCTPVTVTGTTTLTCVIPTGLRAGPADLVITTPTGGSSAYPAALTIVAEPTPTPTPTPTPSPTPTPRTTLAVAAHGTPIKANRHTVLVRGVTSNGRVTKARAWCELRGNRLRGAVAKRLCDLTVAMTSVDRGRVRIAAAPTCSRGLKIHAAITAKKAAHLRNSWAKVWRVRSTPPIACRIRGTG